MIQNPTVAAFRYDPYSKVLTSEGYDTEKMKENRLQAIRTSQSPQAKRFGLILGTLGRQGNTSTFDRIKTLLQKNGKTVIPFLMAEIQPHKLVLLGQAIDVRDIHPYIPLYPPIYPYIPLYTPIYPYIPLYTPIHPYTPLYTPIHPYTPTYISNTPLYTHIHLLYACYTLENSQCPLFSRVSFE